MRALILLTFFAAPAFGGSPCGSGLVLGAEPDVPCDAPDIDIARACHCGVPRREGRPWGATRDFGLEMPRTLRVKSGATTEIPFTLTYRGETPVAVDFPGGDVVWMAEIRRGKKPVPGAACGELTVLPDPVRLTLRSGSRVRGTVAWIASNSQLASCADMATALAPGRYTVMFATVSGEPRLEANIDVTVVKR